MLFIDYSTILGENRRKHPKAKFHASEDEALKKLVDEYGESNWQAIARIFHRRSIQDLGAKLKTIFSWRKSMNMDMDGNTSQHFSGRGQTSMSGAAGICSRGA
jgi:hypothetical protein